MQNDYKKYIELNVWIEARKLVSDIYTTTRLFPKDEQFGLSNQMRRCAVSIPLNVAEGCGRNHKKDSLQFFFIARGALYELETQLFLSKDLTYIDQTNLESLLIKAGNSQKITKWFYKIL